MANFIYVFSEEACEKLAGMQYHLLKADRKKNIFVFLNRERQQFSKEDFPYALSDTLTF